MLTKFPFVLIEFANNQLQKKKFHLDATSIVITHFGWKSDKTPFCDDGKVANAK